MLIFGNPLPAITSRSPTAAPGTSTQLAASGCSKASDLNLMNAATWSDIAAALGSRDIDTCVVAASRLHKESSTEDVPSLLELLRTGDSFEREAAAWPLAEIAGATHLNELLAAYERGFEEGNDNDGFTAALLEIPALYPVEARVELTKLASSAADPMRAHATWLLDFCEPT
jgi:hypothetical protein